MDLVAGCPRCRSVNVCRIGRKERKRLPEEFKNNTTHKCDWCGWRGSEEELIKVGIYSKREDQFSVSH